jgi:hypothetical protein
MILSGYIRQFCHSAWSFDSVSEQYAASIFRLHPYISGALFLLAWTKFCPLAMNLHTPLPNSFIYFYPKYQGSMFLRSAGTHR